MKTSAPKVKDVARIAGVSTATVSRVLNDPDKVSEATRAAVLEAVKQTGYRVNQAARNLRTNTTRTILALVPNLANPFFSNILSGLEREFATANYNLLVTDSAGGKLSALDIGRLIAAGQADGLIILDGNSSRADIEQVQDEYPECPLVYACEWVEGFAGPSVRADNEGGIRLLADHLWDHGHRCFGHVTGPADNILSRYRRHAFETRLQELGGTVKDNWIIPGDFSIASGSAAAEKILQMTDQPTAWICASDTMAFGMISTFTRAGLDVPGDVSVTGFDNIEMTEVFNPPLTTIHQHRNKMGQQAARCMLDRLANRPAAETQGVVMPVYLIARGSSGPVRGR